MELKATTIDNWNALLNPGTYAGGSDGEYPEQSPTGCQGACEMPPCIIPLLECRRLHGIADFYGFFKPAESHSESHSDSGEESPLRPTRYLTQKTVYFFDYAQTTMTKFPGGKDTGSYASSVRSGTVEITRIETYDFPWGASIGGDFTGTCALIGEENTHTVFSGGGSITTKDYYPEYENGAWVSKLGTTTVNTISKGSESSEQEGSGSHSAAEDNRFDNSFRYQTTQVPAPATPYEPTYGGPPTLPVQSVVYSSPVTWQEAAAEADAWCAAQMPGLMQKGDRSGSTDSDFCTLSKSCGITTTTGSTGFFKYYAQYRWKLHRCSGSYAGLTWQEVFVPQELVNWVKYPTFPATPKPAAHLTTSQKAWEFNGSAPGPRCVPFNSHPYDTADEYADEDRWSPWSALTSIPGTDAGYLLLRNGFISCYRSDYGTVPSEIFSRRGYEFDDMSDLNANGIPDKSE